jgi:hypothetical protein
MITGERNGAQMGHKWQKRENKNEIFGLKIVKEKK